MIGNSLIPPCGIREMDGVDDYLEIPHDSAIDARRVITHSLWFKANSLGLDTSFLRVEMNPIPQVVPILLGDQEFFAHGYQRPIWS